MKKRKERKSLKVKMLSGFTTLLLLVAVVCGLFFTLQSLSTGYVSFGGMSVFRVITGSMEPRIPVGSLLLSKRTDIENIAVSDVVCFKSKEFGGKNIIITHRVTGIYETPDGQILLQTKGDANLIADTSEVTEENLIGRVVWHTGDGSKMAKIMRFLTSDFGFLACIILPVILIAIWVFNSSIKSMRKAIKDVEKQLDEREAERTEAAAITAEEYDEIYQKVREEIRKELEQNAEEAVEQTQESVGQVENGNSQSLDEAEGISPASTTEEPSSDRMVQETEEPSDSSADEENT